MDAQQSLANRDTFDQPTVEALLKNQMQGSGGWNYATGVGYAGLPVGVPQIIGILAKVAEQFTGIPVSTWVAQWTANPVVSNLNTVITDSLAAIYQTSINIQQFLGSLDFTDPAFDLGAAATTFIDIILAPVNKIATLVAGLISSSVIPSLDASKIGSGSFANSFVPGLVSLLNMLFGGPTILSTILASTVPTLDASTIGTGTFGETFFPALPDMRDTLKNAIDGIAGVFGWDDTALADSTTGLVNTVAAQAAEIARLKAANDAADNSGFWGYDDFEWFTGNADTDGGYVDAYLIGSVTQGYLYGTGHEMGGVNQSTPGDWEQFIVFDWLPTETDYQRVSTVLSNSFNYRSDGVGDDREVRMHIYLRYTDTTHWTRWQIRMNAGSGILGIRARLQYRNGGATTDLGSEVSVGNIPAGSTVEAVAGQVGAPRLFQLSINGSIEHQITDSGNVTAFGGKQTAFGEGYHANNFFLVAQPFPFINHFVISDNIPAAKLGSGASAWRTSTTAIGSTNGINPFPTGFLQTFEATPDITIDTNWGGMYPTKAGWYDLYASVKISSGFPDRIAFRLLEFNGSAFINKEYGSGGDFARTMGAGLAAQVPRRISATWTAVYIDPDDTTNSNRYLGYDSGSANAVSVFTGEATGMETVFRIALSNYQRPA